MMTLSFDTLEELKRFIETEASECKDFDPTIFLVAGVILVVFILILVLVGRR